MLLSISLIFAGFVFHLIVKLIDFSQSQPSVSLKEYFTDRDNVLSIAFSLVSLIPVYFSIPDVEQQTPLTFFTIGFANSSLLKSVASFLGPKIIKKNASS